MKVLIETFSNHRGYKIFEDVDEMNAYLGKHCDDIASYEVLQEDNTEALNDMLKALTEDCEVIHNKLFNIYREQKKLGKAKQYQQLINAAGRVYEAVVAIRKCLK